MTAVYMLEVIGSEFTTQDIQVDNFGLNLPLLFKMHKIWSVDYHEASRHCCQQMSDFKATVHQIRFRLGLHLTTALHSPLHLTTSKVMLIVWKLRGNIIRTELFYMPTCYLLNGHS